MKILFCNKYSYRFSGTEVYLFEAMELLRSRGHQVELFSMAGAGGPESPFAEHLPRAVDFKSPGQGIRKRAMLAGHAIYSTEARHSLRQVIAQFQPDVAHVRNIYHHLSPSILWELHAQSVPVLYHLNDFKLVCPSYNLVANGNACERCRGKHFWHVVTSGCYAGAPGSCLVLAAEAYLHRWLGTYRKCVDRFLAPSYFVRDKLVEYGWDATRIDVLYHPQQSPEHAPEAAAVDAPILYFGRLSSEKGVSDLLLAMRKLPAIHLQIAGEGPQKAALQSMAAGLQLRNLEFLGYVERTRLDAVIARSRFTILPSLAYETLGKSILESYAQARPVIATDLGSRLELITPGKTGLLYRPGDHDELASRIAFLCSQPRLIRSMGEAGYELVRQRHSPEKHYAALVELYTSLLTPARQVRTSRPVRVAFIGGRGVSSKYSGIETWYEEVGRRLAEQGHVVTVYCRDYFTPPRVSYQGMRIVRVPTLRTKHLDTLVHTALSTVHAMFGHYDVVHYHALGPALFSFLPRLMGKKSIVTVQGLDWQRRKWGRLAATVLRLGEHAAVRLPNSTIVVSRTLQRHYHDRYGAGTMYIPNGTELRERAPVRYLPQWGLQAGTYVLFLGRFSPEKNCDLLIRAFEGIETDVKLVLAGGSSHSDEYVRELRRHQNSRIVLLDWVHGEALDELLTNAMLFVLPSDLEGLSLALLDAMGAGLCVLASDVPENRELVDGAGFSFHRGDEQDLRAMLRALISDAPRRATASAAARDRVRRKYLWENVTRQVEREYEKLVYPAAVQMEAEASDGVGQRAA